MIATGEAGIQHIEINRVVDDTNNVQPALDNTSKEMQSNAVDDLPRIPDENILDVS